MKLRVLMAVKEGIAQGKRIDFERDEKSSLYIASCEGRAFGVAKSLLTGKKCQFKKLGDSFSGIAVKVRPEIRDMEVKIMKERGRKKWKRRC